MERRSRQAGALMDLNKILQNAEANPVPEELRPIIERVLSGEVKSIVVLIEEQDGGVGDLFCLDMNGGQSNVYAVLGAIEALKRDFMRAVVESRVPYHEAQDDDGND